MAYFAPYVDSSGLHIPTYSDILADLKTQMQSIFGSDIYLENDSVDGQTLAVFALKIFDTMSAIQLAYNNRSPITAIGAALDSIVKLNGLSRKVPSYSTCIVTLTGTAGKVIANGIVQDINGYKWDLPTTVTIGSGGTVDATAICETIGAITALPGDLSIIFTPTSGWTSVTNSSSAVAGQPVEADSTLRSRQAISTALPSNTELAGTTAAIAALAGVSRYAVFENPTNSTATDPNGLSLPAHSITCVVEGATDADVAQVIYNNRGIGCYMNGTTTVNITDPLYGNVTAVKFYRPSYVPIYAAISIHPLSGYTSATDDAIKAALVAYLNGLQIHETVTISGLYGAALSVMANLALPTFSIRSLTAGISAEALSGNDIAIDFNKVSSGVLANVTLTEV